MKRLVLILAVSGTGCVADSGDEGFVVRNNLAPATENCSFTASVSAPFISRGFLSTASPSPYLLTPLIESRISAAAGQESQRTVSLMGAKVDLEIGPITVEDVDGNITFSCTAGGTDPCFTDAELDALATAGTTKFRSLFSAPLAPNGGLSSATFDAVPTTAVTEIERKVGTIPASSRMHAQLIATATIYGNLGGDELNGLPYVYPVTVCNDCIVNVVGACADLASTFAPRIGNPCNPFQDGTVDCCTSPGGLSCPAVGTAP